MRNIAARQRICLLLGILALAFIWGNSLQTAEESSAVSGGLLQWFAPIFDGLGIPEEWQHDLLRKTAHMAEFAALALLWCGALLNEKRERIWAVLAICVMAAAVDETIQLFVSGRSGELRDVLIDTAGAAVGTGFAVILRAVGAQRGRK